MSHCGLAHGQVLVLQKNVPIQELFYCNENNIIDDMSLTLLTWVVSLHVTHWM